MNNWTFHCSLNSMHFAPVMGLDIHKFVLYQFYCRYHASHDHVNMNLLMLLKFLKENIPLSNRQSQFYKSYRVFKKIAEKRKWFFNNTCIGLSECKFYLLTKQFELGKVYYSSRCWVWKPWWLWWKACHCTLDPDAYIFSHFLSS